MFVVVDRFRFSEGRGAEHWMERLEGMEDQPGFLSLECLELVPPDREDTAEYLVLMRWRFEEGYARWSQRGAPADACPGLPVSGSPRGYLLRARRSARFLSE